MFLDARGLDQRNVGTKLLGSKDSLLELHSDDTSKQGHSYTTFGVQSGEEVFVVELRKSGAEDAQSQLELFTEILEDFGGSLNKGNGN